MKASQWKELLDGRGVDRRIVALICDTSETRTVEPPTTDTKQLLIALEPDGYAAGRVGKSVLSLFFDPDRARRIARDCDLEAGPRGGTGTTWVVRIPAAELDDRSDLAHELFAEALDRIAPLGSWNRGLDESRKAQGDLCPVHFVQRSLTGECPECEA